jgi:hypothetical protein
MLQEAEHGLTAMAMQGQQGRYAADETLLVKFFMHPQLNNARTKEEGRPIYEEKPYIQIMQPGNKDSIIIRPATRMDKERFAEHFRKFEAREDQDAIEGTLISEWPGVTRAQAEELKYLNVVTVEQLASISDSNAQNIMGIQLLKQKAERYLEASKEEAIAEKFNDLQAKYDDLMARLEQGEMPEEVEAEDDED